MAEEHKQTVTLDSRVTVSTADNVDLSFPLAGIGTRAVAFIIDYLIQSVLCFLLLFGGYSGVILFLGEIEAVFNLIIALALLATAVIYWGYFIFFELAWQGQSPGKRAMGIRVLRDDGRRVNFLTSFIRNVLRLADMLPGLYAVGLISVFVSPREKRLGDLAAGTIVVRTTAVKMPPRAPAVILPAQVSSTLAPLQLQKQLHKLTVEEIELLREFLERRFSLAGGRREELAHRLAHSLAVKLGLERPPVQDELFLKYLDRLLEQEAGDKK